MDCKTGLHQKGQITFFGCEKKA